MNTIELSLGQVTTAPQTGFMAAHRVSGLVDAYVWPNKVLLVSPTLFSDQPLEILVPHHIVSSHLFLDEFLFLCGDRISVLTHLGRLHTFEPDFIREACFAVSDAGRLSVVQRLDLGLQLRMYELRFITLDTLALDLKFEDMIQVPIDLSSATMDKDRITMFFDPVGIFLAISIANDDRVCLVILTDTAGAYFDPTFAKQLNFSKEVTKRYKTVLETRIGWVPCSWKIFPSETRLHGFSANGRFLCLTGTIPPVQMDSCSSEGTGITQKVIPYEGRQITLESVEDISWTPASYMQASDDLDHYREYYRCIPQFQDNLCFVATAAPFFKDTLQLYEPFVLSKPHVVVPLHVASIKRACIHSVLYRNDLYLLLLHEEEQGMVLSFYSSSAFVWRCLGDIPLYALEGCITSLQISVEGEAINLHVYGTSCSSLKLSLRMNIPQDPNGIYVRLQDGMCVLTDLRTRRVPPPAYDVSIVRTLLPLVKAFVLAIKDSKIYVSVLTAQSIGIYVITPLDDVGQDYEAPPIVGDTSFEEQDRLIEADKLIMTVMTRNKVSHTMDLEDFGNSKVSSKTQLSINEELIIDPFRNDYLQAYLPSHTVDLLTEISLVSDVSTSSSISVLTADCLDHTIVVYALLNNQFKRLIFRWNETFALEPVFDFNPALSHMHLQSKPIGLPPCTLYASPDAITDLTQHPFLDRTITVPPKFHRIIPSSWHISSDSGILSVIPDDAHQLHIYTISTSAEGPHIPIYSCSLEQWSTILYSTSQEVVCWSRKGYFSTFRPSRLALLTLLQNLEVILKTEEDLSSILTSCFQMRISISALIYTYSLKHSAIDLQHIYERLVRSSPDALLKALESNFCPSDACQIFTFDEQYTDELFERRFWKGFSDHIQNTMGNDLPAKAIVRILQIHSIYASALAFGYENQIVPARLLVEAAAHIVVQLASHGLEASVSELAAALTTYQVDVILCFQLSEALAIQQCKPFAARAVAQQMGLSADVAALSCLNCDPSTILELRENQIAHGLLQSRLASQGLFFITETLPVDDGQGSKLKGQFSGLFPARFLSDFDRYGTAAIASFLGAQAQETSAKLLELLDISELSPMTLAKSLCGYLEAYIANNPGRLDGKERKLVELIVRHIRLFARLGSNVSGSVAPMYLAILSYLQTSDTLEVVIEALRLISTLFGDEENDTISSARTSTIMTNSLRYSQWAFLKALAGSKASKSETPIPLPTCLHSLQVINDSTLPLLTALLSENIGHADETLRLMSRIIGEQEAGLNTSLHNTQGRLNMVIDQLRTLQDKMKSHAVSTGNQKQRGSRLHKLQEEIDLLTTQLSKIEKSLKDFYWELAPLLLLPPEL
ncbi:hypothetical protein GMRT_12583 [Giardia muris]|uniref:Uncharacterized protein n=1 Tax=Giardia muris TaxID=5742 RepID=A0A4Z1T7H6_GIAMU|nr:hypothetical protein GMRT_12583 [Giardia muris]|eukprot:TNJ28451.1 hypothetical protein GMRT_12583 [Giardia muris]